MFAIEKTYLPIVFQIDSSKIDRRTVSNNLAFVSVLLFDLLERRSFLEKDFGKNSSYLRPITNIDEPNVFHIS